MRYVITAIINRPIKEVAPLIRDPDHYSKWMEGLQSHDFLEGKPGAIGSKARFRFKIDGRDMEMVQTVQINSLPDEYTVIYEADGVWNRVRNLFVSLPDGRTRYENHNEFRFKGLFALFAIFMKGSFKKQSEKYMNAFKSFVEER